MQESLFEVLNSLKEKVDIIYSFIPWALYTHKEDSLSSNVAKVVSTEHIEVGQSITLTFRSYFGCCCLQPYHGSRTRGLRPWARASLALLCWIATNVKASNSFIMWNLMHRTRLIFSMSLLRFRQTKTLNGAPALIDERCSELGQRLAFGSKRLQRPCSHWLAFNIELCMLFDLALSKWCAAIEISLQILWGKLECECAYKVIKRELYLWFTLMWRNATRGQKQQTRLWAMRYVG